MSAGFNTITDDKKTQEQESQVLQCGTIALTKEVIDLGTRGRDASEGDGGSGLSQKLPIST